MTKSVRQGMLRGVLTVWLALAGVCPLAGALEWESHPGYRRAPIQPALTSRVGFTELPAVNLGITFTNFVQEERVMTNRNLTSGSGVALGDVDGDGWCDVFLVGIDARPRLYRNLSHWRFAEITDEAFPGGELRGPELGFDGTGAALADVDGDGDLDLLLNGLGSGTRLWLNDGKGRFHEVTEAAGLRSRTGATSLALADVDGDGDLDLYVCNFRPDTFMDRPGAKFRLRQVEGRPVVIAVNGRSTSEPDLTNRFELGSDGRVLEFGEPDVLWLNQGSGRFTPVSWTDGTFQDEDGQPLRFVPNDWGLAVHWSDLDGDGRPDLYVCNDLHTPDRLWMNASTKGRVQFRAIAPTALRSNSTFSMGVDFGDLNRDGFTDLFMVDMLGRKREDRARQLEGLAPVSRPPGQFEDRVQLLRNALQLNRGDTTFAETTIFSGVEASDWSWNPIFLDVDLDGYEDILITNGQLRDYQDSDGAERIVAAQAGGRTLTPADVARLTQTFPIFATPNVLFRNLTGTRLTGTNGPRPSSVVPVFTDMAREWGFATVGISQGAALADLDNDGDLDVVTNHLLGAPGIYRNDSDAPRVAVRLRGNGGNTRGIGARISVRVADARAPFPKEQTQHVIAGSRYLSSDEPLRVFATGTAARVDIEVRWPSGRIQTLADIPANSLVEVWEPTETQAVVPAAPAPSARLRFVDVSSRLDHTHQDEDFDDFVRQPLLPNKLSQLGPGVAWTDFNDDGFPDLVVGAGRSGMVAVFLNDGHGGFRRSDDAMFNRPVNRDLTTLLPIGPMLLAGSSNWEDGLTNGGALRLYDRASQRSGEAVLGIDFSVGPLAAADVDGDGELEIFIGGRTRPGRWPEPAPSLLLRSDAGRLTIAARFENLGRVSGACFTDFDGDGDPDLVVAGDWGPLRLLRNETGVLVEFEPLVQIGQQRVPLGRLLGLWNSVTAGDFDGDGRLDLVAGNWGLNNPLTSSLPPDERPSLTGHDAGGTVLRRLLYGVLEEGGPVEVIEAVPGPAGDGPARELPMWSRSFPWLRTQVPTYAAFGQATIDGIFGPRIAETRRLELTWLASTLFLNRGDHWEARALPDWAQLSPVFGLAVADADGDGAEDLFLAQNWFATDPLTARQDAGRGLWLLGDGRGGFSVEQLSGIAIYGEQRAAAIADFDGDGRPDLVVTQNAGATRLFRNERAQPGLQVILAGGASPTAAVGSSVRLVFGDRPGPWRELRLGAGYWSVDSLAPVLAQPEPATALEVRWPGGQLHRAVVPVGAQVVRMTRDGTLTVVR